MQQYFIDISTVVWYLNISLLLICMFNFVCSSDWCFMFNVILLISNFFLLFDRIGFDEKIDFEEISIVEDELSERGIDSK